MPTMWDETPFGITAVDRRFDEFPLPPRIRSRTGKTWMTCNHTGFDTQDVRPNWVTNHVLSILNPRSRVLDVGCGFGGLAIQALQAGAEVVATDIALDHLLWCRYGTPHPMRSRLFLRLGEFPVIDFPEEVFDVVLAHRVFHFLEGSLVIAGIRKIYRWLKPNGLLGIVTMSASHAQFRDMFLPRYMAARESGAPWPGQWLDVSEALPDQACALPDRLHVFEPSELDRLAMVVGLQPIRADYVPMTDLGCPENRDGREHSGVIAEKP